jgi:hypothetical protein
MNSTVRRIVPFAVGVLALGSILVARPALAAPVEWNQERVLVLARQLGHEVVQIKDSIAHARETADPNSPRWVVLDDLMQLQHRVIVFEALVSAGEGQKETAPVFRRIRTAVKHARRDAPAFPEIQRQKRHLDRASEALEKLNAFYQSK